MGFWERNNTVIVLVFVSRKNNIQEKSPEFYSRAFKYNNLKNLY